jgi:nitroreductase
MSTAPLVNPRQAAVDIDPAFIDRWSPRAFEDAPLDDAQVAALFEAARWAPSSSNEQPWVFLFARSAADRARFTDLLSGGNRNWAGRAPLLIFLATRRTIARNGRVNRHAGFDAGAAWMSLALQARRLGLHAHAMGGFDQERAYGELGVDPETHEIMVAIAVGRRVAPEAVLPEDLVERERPNGRAETERFVFEGGMPSAPGHGADQEDGRHG